VRRQRRIPFLPAFAGALNMGAAAEMDGIPAEADQFGEVQAGLDSERQQGVVADGRTISFG